MDKFLAPVTVQGQISQMEATAPEQTPQSQTVLSELVQERGGFLRGQGRIAIYAMIWDGNRNFFLC